MAKKNRPDRSKQQRELDYVTIARMYVQGFTLIEIGKEVGLSDVRVYEELKVIKERWKEAQITDFNEKINEQLTKIDAMEHEAWQAWLKSKGIKSKNTKKLQVVGREEEVLEGSGVVTEPDFIPVEEIHVEEDTVGDPRFLQIIGGCIERRCRLLGLDAPQKISPTDPTGRRPYVPILSNDQRIQALTALIELKRAEDSGQNPKRDDSVGSN